MWNLGSIAPYIPDMLRGLVVTIKLSCFGGVLSIVLAVVLALCRISPKRWLAGIIGVYVDFFRSIPLLVLLIYAYFVVGPLAARLGIDTFWLAVIVFGINSSAYQAEVYRAALEAVPKAQWQASYSIGFGWISTVVRVIIPQAIPASIPTTVNLLIYLIKGSALASLITVPELTQQATVAVAATFLPLQTYVVVALMYLALVLPLTLLSKVLERRLGGHVPLIVTEMTPLPLVGTSGPEMAE